jgi:hypothetical protein
MDYNEKREAMVKRIDQNQTDPIGLYNFGVSYLDTARAAVSSGWQLMFDDPIEFLCAQGLELIFKADATRTQSQEAVRKKFGHDLLALRENLTQEFLDAFEIDQQIDSVIQYLSIGHSGPNWRNRYLETGSYQGPLSVEQLLSPLDRFNTENRSWLIDHYRNCSVPSPGKGRVRVGYD